MSFAAPRSGAASILVILGYTVVRQTLNGLDWIDLAIVILALNFPLLCFEPPRTTFPDSPYEIPFTVGVVLFTGFLYLADASVGFAFVLVALVIATASHAFVVVKNHLKRLRLNDARR